MLFAFPGELRWSEDRDAVEFDVKIGEYAGVVFVERRVFHHLLGARPSPEDCVQHAYLNRTLLERIVERKIRNRDLAEDGNVTITSRDLRRA